MLKYPVFHSRNNTAELKIDPCSELIFEALHWAMISIIFCFCKLGNCKRKMK